MDDMYMINTVHFVGYRKLRYTWKMRIYTACKVIFWATVATGDLLVLGYLFTGIGK